MIAKAHSPRKAAMVCRLCSTPIAPDESSATVGPMTLHLERWIARVGRRERLSRGEPSA
jgi:hypothetical protein